MLRLCKNILEFFGGYSTSDSETGEVTNPIAYYQSSLRKHTYSVIANQGFVNTHIQL